MKPWIRWLAGAGLAVVCLTGWGCGGGDVPDPGSDSAAATEGAAEGGQPPAAAPEPVAAAAPAEAAQAPAAAENAGQTAQPAEEAPAQASAGADAAAPKGAGNSATAEMLAIATGSQNPPGSESAPAQGQRGAGAAGAPGGPGGPGGMMTPNPQAGGMRPNMGPGAGGYGGGGGQSEQMARMQQQQQQQQQQGQSRGGMPAGYPGMGNQAEQMARMQKGMMGQGPGGPGGPGAMSSGGPGGSSSDNGPADTHTAAGAVRAFFKALQAKDRDALAEATAQRAAADSPLETTSPHKELFGRILDGSISDSELDDLASKLEGFKVAGEDAPKSTGRLKVYADKTDGRGGRLRRVFTLRKERKGWGVMDISIPMEFKSPRMFNRRQQSGKR